MDNGEFLPSHRTTNTLKLSSKCGLAPGSPRTWPRLHAKDFNWNLMRMGNREENEVIQEWSFSRSTTVSCLLLRDVLPPHLVGHSAGPAGTGALQRSRAVLLARTLRVDAPRMEVSFEKPLNFDALQQVNRCCAFDHTFDVAEGESNQRFYSLRRSGAWRELKDVQSFKCDRLTDQPSSDLCKFTMILTLKTPRGIGVGFIYFDAVPVTPTHRFDETHQYDARRGMTSTFFIRFSWNVMFRSPLSCPTFTPLGDSGNKY